MVIIIMTNNNAKHLYNVDTCIVWNLSMQPSLSLSFTLSGYAYEIKFAIHVFVVSLL